jgi:hemerythrin
MCIYAGGSLAAQDIYRIDNLDAFQAELGFTKLAMYKKVLFDEFIWSEYIKENAPQSPADLQARLVSYLVERCQAFRQKYFGNDQQNASSIWDESMCIGIQTYDDQRKDLSGLIELLDKDPKHTNSNENFLGRFHTLQVVVQEYFVREDALMEQMNVPVEVREQHIAEHEAILEMFLNTYFDSMHHKGRTAFEVYWQFRETLKHHFLTCDIKLKDYAKNVEG